MNKTLIISIIILILLIPLTLGMGFGQEFQARILVEPGFESPEYHYQIIPTSSETMDYTIFTEGYLSEYITIDQTDKIRIAPNEYPFINAKVKIPDDLDITTLEPGLHKPVIRLYENPIQQGGSGVTVRTGVKIIIEMLVLYDNKFLQIDNLNIPDINDDQFLSAEVKVSNFGKESLNSIKAIIEILDQQDNLITSFETDETSLASPNSVTLHGLTTQKFQSGAYKAKAKVIWDGQTSEIKSNFKVGTMDVKINSFTQEIEKGKINEFSMQVESIWNNQIENLYGVIDFNGEQIQTASITLEPWKINTLKLFINTEAVEIGSYPITMKLFTSNQELRTMEGTLNVIKKISTDTKQTNPLMTIMYVLIILIFIIAIIGVLLIRKHKNKKTHRK